MLRAKRKRKDIENCKKKYIKIHQIIRHPNTSKYHQNTLGDSVASEPCLSSISLFC
jgi:hypothetical protein